MKNFFVVTGGSRSGKSTFAEKFVTKLGKKIAYIATAEILDDEMKNRVALHQQRRPSNWKTFESPYNADETIKQIREEKFDTILFDCVTIYLSNLICSLEKPEYDIVKNSIDKLIFTAEEFCLSGGNIVFVTNEVGSGIVPENALARVFRDFAGLVNQNLADHAEKIFLVVAGIPIDIKQFEYRIED